jgi:putative DNA primase/helicase
LAALDAAWEAQRCAKAKDFSTLDDYEPDASAKGYSRSQGRSDGRTLSNLIDVCAPYDVAKLLLDRNFATETKRTLHRYRGGFYHWNGSAYPEIAEDALRSHVYSFLSQCETLDRRGHRRRVKPHAAMVANVLDALRAASHLDENIAPPIWLDQVLEFPAAEIIACSNGLLHLPTRTLLRHSPDFFTHNAVDFAFDREASEPRQWLAFLDQVWGNDLESICTLQEAFGLCLTSETRFQKSFLLVGPTRSGKGTIARVLTALVGRRNVVSPTLASLGDRFGLAPLIGKLLAIISDARIGHKADQHAIAESVLRITGEDDVSCDRKNRDPWNGRLRVRFVVISNELPRLTDASGALVSRFIILRLVNSFYGREDQGLTETLLAELPGILNWAVIGWHRLSERGHFVQPQSALDDVQHFEDLASPIGAFLRDRCVVAADRMVGINRLFEAWSEWRKAEGHEHVGIKTNFGKDLKAVLPWLKVSQPRDGEDRLRVYRGIGLK